MVFHCMMACRSKVAFGVQVFRATNGQQKVWGREPSKIVATYTTGDGQEKKSLLLCSGPVLLLPQSLTANS